MEENLISKVPRSLEIKSKFCGFELPDLMLIFLNLALTNLAFGSSSLRYFLVWGTTLGLALFLYLVKRGKPEKFLLHYLDYLKSPAYRSAGVMDSEYKPILRKK